MNREELVQQLAARGIETAAEQSDERLAELLSAVVAAEEAERAAEADGAGEDELAAYEAAVERVKQVMEAAAADLGGTLADAAASDAPAQEGDGQPADPQETAPPAEEPATPPEPEAPAKGRGGRRSQPEADPTELVSCVLGPRSPAGRLLVGNAAIEAKKPGRIPRGEFDRLQAEYDLVEVEG